MYITLIEYGQKITEASHQVCQTNTCFIQDLTLFLIVRLHIKVDIALHKLYEKCQISFPGYITNVFIK